MKTKISKAQREVWEWKAKAYEAVKHLPLDEQIAEIHRQTAETMEELRQKQKAEQHPK